MNYQDAKEMLQAYSYLEGVVYKGKTISTLLIAPLKEIGIPKLMFNLLNEVSSDQFYEQYNEFEIWVIFDAEDWELTGVLSKVLLSQFLKEFSPTV